MKLLDYLRLSCAGLKIHRKRTAKIVFLTGLIFIVITSTIFILQGIENTILKSMTKATSGQILVKTSIDSDYCVKTCDYNENIKQIKNNIQKYHGKILDSTNINLENKNLYKLEGLDNLKDAGFPNQSDSSFLSISAPIETILELVNIQPPELNAKIDSKTSFIKTIVNNTLHKVITTKSGKKVYISNIYPSNFFSPNLAHSNTNLNLYPLDIIFSQIDSTKSISIVETNKVSEPDTHNMKTNTTEVQKSSEVLAVFNDILSASNYYHDKQNYCPKLKYTLGNCGENYRYHIESAISNPINTYEKFKEFWSIFQFVVIALSVLLFIITTSTYTRIIAKDKNIISLYKSMHATKRQITIIFALKLLVICIITIILSIAISFIFTLIFNITNIKNIQNTLTIGLSTIVDNIFVFGWNRIISIPIYGLIASVALAVIINNQSFYPKK